MLQIWKLQRGTLDRSLLHPSKATRLTVLPDTGQLVTGHVDGNVRFWDPRTRNFVNEIVGLHGTHEVLSVTVANRGGKDFFVCVLVRLYLTDHDGGVLVLPVNHVVASLSLVQDEC